MLGADYSWWLSIRSFDFKIRCFELLWHIGTNSHIVLLFLKIFSYYWRAFLKGTVLDVRIHKQITRLFSIRYSKYPPPISSKMPTPSFDPFSRKFWSCPPVIDLFFFTHRVFSPFCLVVKKHFCNGACMYICVWVRGEGQNRRGFQNDRSASSVF